MVSRFSLQSFFKLQREKKDNIKPIRIKCRVQTACS